MTPGRRERGRWFGLTLDRYNFYRFSSIRFHHTLREQIGAIPIRNKYPDFRVRIRKPCLIIGETYHGRVLSDHALKLNHRLDARIKARFPIVRIFANELCHTRQPQDWISHWGSDDLWSRLRRRQYTN